VLAYTTSSADADNSGIVEESIGGVGSAFVVVLTILAVPALVVAVVEGLLSRHPGRGRAIVRGTAFVLLAMFGGVFVAVAPEIECDGTCTDFPVAVWLAALGAAELALIAAWLVGRAIARLGRAEAR
jgi:hypothetical protein